MIRGLVEAGKLTLCSGQLFTRFHLQPLIKHSKFLYCIHHLCSVEMLRDAAMRIRRERQIRRLDSIIHQETAK